MSTKTVKASKSNFITLKTSKGSIVIKTLPKLAPNHVKRIKDLVSSGFYDGIIFHRVIPGFMAQTGDPLGNGTGGSGQKLNAEFSDYQYTSFASTPGSRKRTDSAIVGKDGNCLTHFSDAAQTKVRCVTYPQWILCNASEWLRRTKSDPRKKTLNCDSSLNPLLAP